MSNDFMYAVEDAREGDFVFCDPPYMPRAGCEFVGYTPDGFGLKDHVRLRDTMLALKKNGVRVLIANSDVEPIREMYSIGFEIAEVRGKRSIGANGFRRGRMPDLLIW